MSSLDNITVLELPEVARLRIKDRRLLQRLGPLYTQPDLRSKIGGC